MPPPSNLSQLKKIFFPVEKREASDELGHSSWLSHEIVVMPPGMDKPYRVNVCSADYGLVSNESLIMPIWDALSQEYPDLEVKVVMSDYAQFYIDIVIKKGALRGANKKDTIFPRLRVYNSYNGAVKFSFLLALYRVICGNGATAVIPDTERRGTFMHTAQLKDDGSAAESVMNKLVPFIAKAKEIVRGYDPLIEHTLTQGAAIERIAEVQQQTDFPKKLVEHAAARLTLEATELKQPINDYLVYNAINYALFNSGETALAEHKKDKKDAEVLQYLLADNE